MPGIAVLALVFFRASVFQEPPPSQDPLTTAFVHVAVLPMDRGAGEALLLDQTVLVRGTTIEALGPSSAVGVPDGARVIDGGGRFLMPGLADMHVHAWDENDLFLFVANGVTTIRNMFGSPLQLEWRERIGAGELVGPRIYTAGPIIDGSPPVWPGSSVLTDPDQAAEIVRAQKEAGYDFLKPYARLSAECYEALVVAGEDEGMRLMGHVPSVLRLEQVLEARQATVEHLDGWAEAAQPADSPHRGDLGFDVEFLAWKRVDPARLVELATRTREAGVWTCPTFVVYQRWCRGDAATAMLARPEMRYVSPGMKAAWSPNSPFNYLQGMPDELVANAHAALEPMGRALVALRDAGAGILAGTDMGNPFVTAGFALHDELTNLTRAGLTPLEALRAATANAAACMEARDAWGTIAPGRAADLVLLDANPLEDVANAARRAGVMLRGRWFPEAELVAELERRAREFEAPGSKEESGD